MGRPRSKTWAWVSTLDAMANRGTADTGRTPCGLRHARRGAGGMGPDSRNGGYIFPFFKTDLFIPDQYGNPASALLSRGGGDRKSTRLNSSHTVISYAVFCLKKK